MIPKYNNKRYNKLLNYRNNYYDIGGYMLPDSLYGSLRDIGLDPVIRKLNMSDVDLDGMSQYTTKPKPKPKLLDKLKIQATDALKAGTLNGAITAVGGMADSAIGGGLTSGAGEVFSGLGSLASNIPGPWGAAIGAGLKVVGGLTNRAFGSKMNEENINAINATTNRLNNFESNASNFDTLADTWETTALGTNFSDNYVGKDGWFSKKAKNKAKELRDKTQIANAFVENSLLNNANNISRNTMNDLEANYAAFGGYLNTHGTSFPTGLTMINAGGTHENNPYEGVPMGVDNEGKPNLVEEGEVIYNDYVFSNRLTVPKAVRNKYKLKNAKNITFANAAKQLTKNIEERPNDPISKETTEEVLSSLMNDQEQIRIEKEQRQLQKVINNLSPEEQMRLIQMGQEQMYQEPMEQESMEQEQASQGMYAHGGSLNNKFDGTGNIPNYLNFDNKTSGIKFEEAPDYNVYDNNGGIDFNKVYAADSPYMKRRQFVLDNWDNTEGISYRNRYINALNYYNKDRKDYTPYTLDTLTKDIYSKITNDYKWGQGHSGLVLAGNPTINKQDRYFLRGTDKQGKATVTPMTITPWKDRNELGQTFAEAYPNYNFVGKQERPQEGNTIYTDYYYDVKPKEEKKDLSPQELKNSPEWLRYAPTVGLGLATLSDTLGLTNKPNYNEAAMVEAASRGGSYLPVSWNPIGNKLTYNPFDRDYYTNKLNANSSAARRAIMNQSAGNSGRAIAGILASDYNSQNQLGDLFRKAEEYNLEQRQKIEDFNRATNQVNSQGMLQADTANQGAYSNARDFSFRGLMAAAEMRQKARMAAEAARSANLSGLLNSLGDIGYENKNMNMIRALYSTGVLGPMNDEIAERFGLIKNKKTNTKKGAKKSKKNKSLTKK